MAPPPAAGARPTPLPLALAAATLLTGLVLVHPAAQEIRDPRPAWRTRTDAVWVFATVTTREGRPVPDLTRDEFRVFDDGVEQAVTQFSGDRVPVSLGLVVDVSESMRGRRMAEARAALNRFLMDLLRPDDEAFLLAFNHAARLVASWSPPPALRGRLDAVTPSGGTAIYDALSRAAPEFDRRRHQRAALVVISDGADTASDRTLFDIRRDLRRSDAFIYALAIEGENDRPSTRVNPDTLRGITDESGGYTAVVRDAAQLGLETQRIAEELNHQYLIGYATPRPADGAYHSIRVRTTRDGLFVRARRGYVAMKE
jgi:VWFA-related protein